jgi:predicted double-glycine peptidase
MRLRSLACLALLAIGCISGCSREASAPTAPTRDQIAPAARAAHRLVGIPDVMQMNDYSCGVASVQAVAQYYGTWGYQDEFARELGTTPKNGTHPSRIVAYLRKLGLEASLEEGMTIDDLKRQVDAGVPVIIDYQAWGEPAGKDYAKEWEDGHYSIVVGYSGDRLMIEDPSLLGTTGELTATELMTRWHDYETENGKRREYRQAGIVVRGKPVLQPALTHID